MKKIWATGANDRRDVRVCNVCREPYTYGCTNGRCMSCHNIGYCTSGGDTSPGHEPTTPEQK